MINSWQTITRGSCVSKAWKPPSSRPILIYFKFMSKPSFITVICMDPHSPKKLFATQYCFLLLGDEFLFLNHFFISRFFCFVILYYFVIFAKTMLLLSFFLIIFFSWKLLLFFHVPGCSGMFRDVPACSGMFRVLSTPELRSSGQHGNSDCCGATLFQTSNFSCAKPNAWITQQILFTCKHLKPLNIVKRNELSTE